MFLNKWQQHQRWWTDGGDRRRRCSSRDVDDGLIRKRNWRSDWIDPIYGKINGVNGSRVKCRLSPLLFSLLFVLSSPPLFPPLSAIPPYSGNKTHHSTFPEALDVGSNRHQRRLRFLFWVAPSEPMAVQPLPASGPASSVPVFRNWSSGTREPITALTGPRGHSIPTSAVSASSCRQRYFHSIDWIITTTASIRIAVWVSSDPISSADTAGAKRNESVRTPFQLFSVLILRNRTGTISRTASTSQRSGSV